MLRSLVVLSLLSCSPTSLSNEADVGHEAGSSDANSQDARDDAAISDDAASSDTGDADAARDGSLDATSELDDGGMVEPEGRTEVCGNGVDDDGNARIDDGCECTVGTVRPCWLGPAERRNVGSCHDGQQACEPEGAVANWGLCIDQQLPTVEYLANGRDEDCDGDVDEAGGLCVPTGNGEIGACTNGMDDDCDTRIDCDDPDCAPDPACMTACQPTETLCWGGYDDDCDGQVDCEDPECAEDASCTMDETCADAVYTQRTLPRGGGSSSITVGDGEPVMTETCGGSRCGTGQVEVRQGSSSLCVPPPGECPEGQFPSFVNNTWRCEPPCEVIVEYGYLFGHERHCAPRPPPPCATSGRVQTYLEDVEQWVCVSTCDNGEYDRVRLDGQLVCIPC